MNKIKKIIFSVGFLICFFSFFNVMKVNASQIVIFQECEYKYSYGAKGTIAQNNESIFISYTELKTHNNNQWVPQVRLNRSYNSFERMDESVVNGFSMQHPLLTDERMGFQLEPADQTAGSYSTAFINAGQSCPKYMTFELISDDEYKALFYNNLEYSSQCNGNPSTKCKAYYTLVTTLSNVKVEKKDVYWTKTMPASSKGECSDLTINVSIKQDTNQLQASATYGRNSTYTGQESAWGSTPQVIDEVYFEDVYELATSSKLSSGVTFNPDDGAGKETITVNGSKGSDYCTVSGTYNKTYTCLDTLSINTYLSDLEKQVSSAYPNITSIYDQYSRKPGDGTSVPITYFASNDIEKLKTVVSGINEAIEKVTIDEEKIKVLTEKINNLQNGNYNYNEKIPCESTQNYAASIGTDLKKKGEDYYNKLSVIKETLENASRRLQEIETDEAEKQKYAELADNTTTLIEEKSKIVQIVNKTILDDMRFEFKDFSNVDLSYKTGSCGVLSDDMIDFIDLVLWYIKLAGVILAIILSLADYIKAASGSDDKSMANANKKVLMRIIFVAILFLVPAILEFVLGSLNISTTAGSLKCLK